MTHVPITLRLHDAQADYDANGTLLLAQAEPANADWGWDATLNIATGDAFCAVRLGDAALQWLTELVRAHSRGSPKTCDPRKMADHPPNGVRIEASFPDSELHKLSDVEATVMENRGIGTVSLLFAHSDLTAEVAVRKRGPLDGLWRQLKNGRAPSTGGR